MDQRSQDIMLRRIEQNDDTFPSLLIGQRGWNNGDNNARLGAAIGNNTHITNLVIDLDDNSLSVADRGFYDGLKRNSSINKRDFLGTVSLISSSAEYFMKY